MSEWSPGIQKVLDHVAATEGWRLGAAGSIRRQGAAPGSDFVRSLCPGVSCGWNYLPFEDRWTVADAADNYEAGSRFDPDLRAALLKAARLA